MRVVIQRVSSASVSIDGALYASINKGLLILAGFEETDNEEDIAWMSGKIARLRIFNDDKGLMNLSLKDVDGEILLISQFTLHASTKKGNRPSYIRAAKPETAIPLYEKLIKQLGVDTQTEIKTGRFGAMMDVSLTNEGPVTIIMDTKNKE